VAAGKLQNLGHAKTVFYEVKREHAQVWKGPSDSGQRPGVSFDEKSNERLGSINYEFLSAAVSSCQMLSGLW
jgi:hypothetical protein